MDKNLIEFLLKGTVAANMGSTAKEIFLMQCEEEYNNGNINTSVFYQIRALYQAIQERFYQKEPIDELTTDSEVTLNADETENIKTNVLMQYVMESLSQTKTEAPEIQKEQNESYNFMRDIVDPIAGIKKVEEICQQLPNEWTILQLCKGLMPQSTYSTFTQLHESNANIYLTVLRHVRSVDYPKPICTRFVDAERIELFQKFATITSRFKQCITVEPRLCNTKETKKKYWDSLGEINQLIAQALYDLKNFFYPWKYLFTGKPKHMSANDMNSIFAIIDEFCDRHAWESNERVLLSLAALQVNTLPEYEISAICNALTTNEAHQSEAFNMLKQMKYNERKTASTAKTPSPPLPKILTDKKYKPSKHYPCILIVDERMDHFFWEEMNAEQEFCRVNSLQCLYRLYQFYKERIRNGYLMVNITNGGCLVNPDNNLPRTELRMRHFLEYWTPHWRLKFAEKPTQDDLLNDFLKRPCFVYAGHGSGLQYLNGRYIAKQRINSVVFLFGCDSSRLYSCGLYSEMVGTHLYYHAAMCPTLVGTIMPALDANMDMVAAVILSRWIRPNSEHVLPWSEIHNLSWVKDGIIKPQCETAGKETPTIGTTPTYHNGSLCAVLARVHQSGCEAKYYNTVPYVCRGLPAWNYDVEPLP